MNSKPAFYLLRTASLSVALSWTVVVPLVAQNVTIDWFTIDGGGGESVGDIYTISSTLGQCDAGTFRGGNYTVECGFWSGVFSTTPPRLFIARSGLNAVISWSPGTSGYVLQASDSLAPGQWMDAPSGGANPVMVSAGSSSRFYRLIRR